jgi:hypothetical protein
MGTYRLDDGSYGLEIKRRIANTRRRKKIVIGDIVEYVGDVAYRNAPQKTGKLRRGIRVNRAKGTVTAVASNNGFPYLHWVNQTRGTGMKTLHVTTPSGKVNINGIWIKVPGRKMVYGSAPNWKWTGRAQFWTLAIADARKRFLPEVKQKILYAGLMGRV